MAYIDRDKLIRHLEDELEACGEPDSSIRPIAYGTILGLRGALSYARTFPKADVEEVRHGEWENIGNNFAKCSNCETIFEALPTFYFFKINNIFCRHCGARMDGGKNENV